MFLISVVLWLKERHISHQIINFTSAMQCEEDDYYSDQAIWTPWEPGVTRKKNDPASVVIRNIIPAGIPHNTALFIPPYSAFQSFEIFLGKESHPIYTSGKLGPAFSNRHLYLKWHLIPLPPDSGGKYLTFRFHSTHYRYTGLISEVYIGQSISLLTSLVLRDMDITVMALLFIIAGMAATVVFVFDYESKNRQLALFGMMAIFAGFYILTESRITQLFLEITPLFSYLHYISFFVFIIGMTAFIEKSIGPGYRSCIRRAWQILLIVTGSGTVLDLLSLVPWDITFDTGMWIALFFLIPLAVELVKTSISGKYEARIICLGFGIVLFFGFIDLIGGLRVVTLENQAIFPWGLLLLLFSFMWVLVYNYKIEREKNEHDLHQSHEKFRILFEDAPVPIFQFDMRHSNFLLLRANSQAQNLFGYQNTEFHPIHLNDLLFSAHHDILDHMRERLLVKEKHIFEAKGLGKDGNPFPIRIIASMEHFTGSNKAILIMEDLTHEKARRSEEEAIAEERNRIAREIHDGLAQDLATMNMKVSIWKYILKETPDKMLNEIDFFQKLITKNIKDLRRCIFALRPIDLENFGFNKGVQNLICEFSRQHHIHMKFDPSHLTQVPNYLEPVLFRIIQEILNNVSKHAEAKEVHIKLEIIKNSRLILKIEDDGKGFFSKDMDSYYRNGHFGLKQMKERIEKENGRFHIESSPGNGTSLSITIPLT